MKKRPTMLFLLLCSFLVLSEGCASIDGALSKLPDVQSAEWEMPTPNENEKIESGEIVIIPEKSILNHAYDHIRVDIVNNSPYSFSWFNEYNIFEETGRESVLIDDDGDGLTKKRADDAVAVIIPSGETVSGRLYLGEILDGNYTRPGTYKLQVPINEDVAAETSFEITNKYIPLDTNLSIRMESDVVENNSKENFSYFVQNDTEETIQVSLYVHVARYENGEWVRLSPSEKYLEIYYNASLWSENCAPHTKWKGLFQLSLPEMVDAEFVPGKYRLEKQMLFEWYFFEFEVV